MFRRISSSHNYAPITLLDLKDVSDVSGGTGSDEEGMSGMQTWPVRRHRRKPSKGDKELPSVNALPMSVSTDMQ